ncbi:hypothetical protein E1A91_A08G093800v1 [Gossypium mustelinum]|uniref:Uncharacterized protein n=1 Tax=Gossypium mustelinum TaxID=34275 RepID=A0A5D2VU74_GOSMU|nr:hypothetical protein E1A91_D02G108500v1 [Gossypium mustelinum]TYJ21911.1 hypothetical protein E1A91_A08G093800v1 [Gossypium mustelinum]
MEGRRRGEVQPRWFLRLRSHCEATGSGIVSN